MQVVGNGRVVLRDFGIGVGELVRRTRWGRFLWFVRWRGDDWRDLRRDFGRRRPGALVLWFVAVHEVSNTAVVDGVHVRPMWRQFFWFVRMGRGAWRDITSDVERWQAHTLVIALGLVVRRGGAGGNMNGVNGRDDVGATVVVEGVGIGIAGVDATASADIVSGVVSGVVEVLVWRCAGDLRGNGVYAVAFAIVVAGGGIDVAGDVGGVEAAADGNVGVADVEGVGSVADAVRLGAAGLSGVDVEREGALHLGALCVEIKNGGEVVGCT